MSDVQNKNTYEKWTAELSKKVLCRQCDGLFDLPMQHQCCGVITCSECNSLTNSTNRVCEGCGTSNFNAKPDRGCGNELRRLIVNCPNCGDLWVGPYSDLKAHLNTDCTMAIPCKNCGEKCITSRYMRVHQRHRCRIRVSPCPLCSIGCSDEVLCSELVDHLVGSSHQRYLLLAVIRVLREGENSGAHRMTEAQTQQLITECLRKIDLALEQSELTRNECRQLQLKKESIEMKLKAISERVQECNKGITSFQELFLTMKKMIAEMEQDIDTIKRKSATGPQLLDADDTFTWKVHLLLLLNDESLTMNSDTFQTSEWGYRLGVSMSIEIDRKSGERFISVSVIIFAGEFDALLEWPVSYPITLTLMSLSGGQKPICRKIEPNGEKAIFDRPEGIANKPYTISQFCSIQKLLENAPSFIQEDHSYLKVHVDFTTKDMLKN